VAVVLFVALVAAACGTGDGSAAPAAPAARPNAGGQAPIDAPLDHTVALAPGREWLGIDRVSLAAEGPVERASPPTVAFARADATEGAIVFVQRVDEPVPLPEGDEPAGRTLTIDGWSAVTGVDDRSGHRWLTIGRGPQHLAVWGPAALPVDDLVALATALDLGRPVQAQKAVGAWRQRGSSPDSLTGGTVRELQVRRDDLGADLHLTTWLGVDDSAFVVLGSATVAEPRRVRGRPALVLTSPELGEVVITWLEGPGIVAQARYVTDRRPEAHALLVEATAAVDGATRIDPAGWKQMAASAGRYRPPPRPTPDELDPPRIVFTGRLVDGRSYRLAERDDQYLCLTVEGADALTRCDTDRQFWRGRSTQAMPRLVDPGDPADTRSPVLLYGYLPEILLVGEAGIVQSAIGPWLDTGRAVSVHVADNRGRDLGWATIVDDVWIHHVADNDMPLVVTYRFRDGRELEVVPGPGRPDAQAQ
jgi:hypothetical protein